MTIEILLADDHQILRKGILALLEKEPDLTVVGEAEDGRMALRLAMDLKPHIVVMDIGMPHLNGIEATRRIVAELSSTQVLALSMHSDRQFVTGMLHAGALGYILKDSAFEELIYAIREVAAKRVYLSPGITGVIVDYVQKSHHMDSPVDCLSPREREVLQLLAEGNKVKDIASQINISVRTIETHRQHIMDKLDLHSMAELTKFAIRAGLTSLDS